MGWPPASKRAISVDYPHKRLPYAWSKRDDAEKRARQIRERGSRAVVTQLGSRQRGAWLILSKRGGGRS